MNLRLATRADYSGRQYSRGVFGKRGRGCGGALIECLERDTRLTRFQGQRGTLPAAVTRSRSNGLGGRFSRCRSARQVGNRSRSQTNRRGGRVQTTKIRDYWTRYKGVPMAERWYRILADDHAEPEQWLTVARTILQPTLVPVKSANGCIGIGQHPAARLTASRSPR